MFAAPTFNRVEQIGKGLVGEAVSLSGEQFRHVGEAVSLSGEQFRHYL